MICDWEGILVSDGYGVYRQWVMRQSCLARLLRKASELSERKASGIARFSNWAFPELQRLCRMAHAPPAIEAIGAPCLPAPSA
jgi:transposase